MTEGTLGDGIGTQPFDATRNTERTTGQLNDAVRAAADSIVTRYQDANTWKPGDPEHLRPIEGSPNVYDRGTLVVENHDLSKAVGDQELPKVVLSATRPNEFGRAEWTIGVYEANGRIDNPPLRLAFRTGLDDTHEPQVVVRSSTNTSNGMETFIEQYTGAIRKFLDQRSENGSNFTVPDDITAETIKDLLPADGQAENKWFMNLKTAALRYTQMRDILKAVKELRDNIVPDSRDQAQASDAVITRADSIKEALIGEGGIVDKNPKMMTTFQM